MIGGLVAKNNFSDAPVVTAHLFGASANTANANTNPNSNITNSYWNTNTTGPFTSDICRVIVSELPDSVAV